MKKFVSGNWFRLTITSLVITVGIVFLYQEKVKNDQELFIQQETLRLGQENKYREIELAQKSYDLKVQVQGSIEKKNDEQKSRQANINECIAEANLKRVKQKSAQKDFQVNFCYQSVVNGTSRSGTTIADCDDAYDKIILEIEKDYTDRKQTCQNLF